jgi:hypothetical protein
VLRGLGAVAAILILVAGFGIWRLMQGPIALNWLAPYVEAAIARSESGLRVSFSGVRLGIDRDTHQLDLRAEDVRVATRDGAPIARFPEFAASFSLGAILHGRLEPTRLVVESPVLHLVRAKNGAISAQIGSGGAAGPGLGPGMIARLAGPPARDAPLGLLRRLDIRHATLILDDRSNGHSWRADRVDVAVNRSATGVRGNLSLAVPLAGSLPELHVSYRYLAQRQLLDLDMAIDGVEPARIPPLIPELAQLQHIDAPVSGTLRTRINFKTQQPEGGRLDLALGPGRLRSRFLPDGSVAIQKGELQATYAPESESVRLDRLALDLGGGARLVLGGTLSGVTPALLAAPADVRPPARLSGKLDASLTNVPVARFASLWPAAMSPGGRRWTLANVHGGVLDEGALQLALDLDPSAHTMALRNATGTLRYHGLTINYLDGLPPVRQVDGTAKFADDQLVFTPTAGTLKRLKVTGGTLRITHVGAKPEWLTIDLDTTGPLRDAAEIIDAPRLRYAHKIGLDPAHIGGHTNAHLHFRFPLLADLKLDQIEYGAKATITGADLGKVALDRAVTDGNFALDLGQQGAHVAGEARFDGIPARLDATVYFHPGHGAREVYRVGLTLDEAARQRLDLDFEPDRIRGSVGAEVRYAVLGGGRSRAMAQLDLRDAALTIPEAGWKKPLAQPGSATVVLELDHDRITRVPRLEIHAAGIEANLAASLDPRRRRLQRVDIHRLAIGGSVFAGTVSRRPGGGWRADLAGSEFDARHLIKEFAGENPLLNPSSQAGEGRVEVSGAPPLAINARFGRLLLGPGRQLYHVDASLLRIGGSWESARIDGKFADGRHLSISLGDNGGDRLLVRSDDFGAALKLLDITDDVGGGVVAIEGQLSREAGRRVLRAHLDARNYVLVHAPWMARLLALPSLTGLASLLSGTGLPFMLLRGDLVYADGRLTLDRVLASGESLGVTAKGWINPGRGRLDLQGTIAPAYALNSIAGKVPILGRLLGGGEQGLFAANFRLNGRIDEPQVSVNPLSALAPGFLRQLFPAFPWKAPAAAAEK